VIVGLQHATEREFGKAQTVSSQVRRPAYTTYAWKCRGVTVSVVFNPYWINATYNLFLSQSSHTLGIFIFDIGARGRTPLLGNDHEKNHDSWPNRPAF
jgi:hypothetical protein